MRKVKNNNKVLSISVAAYNLENLIEQNLKSWLNKDVMDKIEVLVVDDGSKDNTALVVKKYEKKYKGIIKLIKQKNAGPGSTVNTGLKSATGKYFRMVDGDDWVVTKNLKKYINSLEKSKADMILTNYEIYDNSAEKVIEKVKFNIESNILLKFDDICNKIYPQMHAVTYKTNILKDNKIKLDNGFYTDMEYLLFPLKYINTLEYYNKTIYMYRVGQATQSVSIPSMQKNINMHEMVLNRLINYYNDNKDTISKEKREYLIKLIVPVADAHLGTLLTFKIDKNQINKIKEYNKCLKDKCIDVYNVYKKSKKMKLLIYSNYKLAKLASKIYIKKITR